MSKKNSILGFCIRECGCQNLFELFRVHSTWKGAWQTEKIWVLSYQQRKYLLNYAQIFFFISQRTVKPNCIITACISIVWFFCPSDPEALSNTFSSPLCLYTRLLLSRKIMHICFRYTHICRYIIHVPCVICALIYSSCVCLCSLVCSGLHEKKTGQNQWEAGHKPCGAKRSRHPCLGYSPDIHKTDCLVYFQFKGA